MEDQEIIEPMDEVERFIAVTRADKPVHPGMPKLIEAEKPLAFFEFWPGYLFYIPVVIQSLFLALRYRSLTLPLNANPAVHLSGMVGESKIEIFEKAQGNAKKRIARWALLSNWVDQSDALDQAKQRMAEKALDYPIVVKPDMGCRGVGVRIVRNDSELAEYVNAFPVGGRIVMQKMVPYEAEAGIFYIRYPGEKEGQIFSITLKYPPYVFGNGTDTLKQLIENDPRAGKLLHLYLHRHEAKLQEVLPKGQPFRLAFAGSHSRGCIFRDGRDFITPEMTKSFDQVCNGLGEFYYGRFDIRFRDIDSLMDGKNYYILEVNGASSEAAHIWDCRSSLKEVFRVLFYQYRTLFQLGDINRQRGFNPPSLRMLLKAWSQERRVVRKYPETE